MTSLIARLEAATAPNDDLDDMIFAWENGWSYPLFGAAITDKHFKSQDYRLSFTSSIDAAVALAERVLPNERVWTNRIAFEGKCQWRVSLSGNHTSWSQSPAIAICIAILKAKEASHDPR